MDKISSFFLLAAVIVFVIKRMDLTEEWYIHLLLYLFVLPLLFCQMVKFFIYWKKKNYLNQYLAFLSVVFSVIALCWDGGFRMYKKIESDSVKKAKIDGTYLCSYRFGKKVLKAGDVEFNIHEVFLEKEHYWETYNLNRMGISENLTNLRLIWDVYEPNNEISPVMFYKMKGSKILAINDIHSIQLGDTIMLKVGLYVTDKDSTFYQVMDSVVLYPYFK